MLRPAIAVSISLLLVASSTRADVQVTNLNQTDWGTLAVPADVSPGGPIANGFTTGPGNPWLLRSVSFTVEYTGIGYTDLWVQLRGFTPGFGPGGVIESIVHYTIGPGTSNLVALSSGTVLQPSTQYYVTLFTYPNTVDLHMTEDNPECSVTGWTIEDYAVTKSFGLWYSIGTISFRMAIDADPILPAPIITSIHGCNDTPPKTIDCPNSGGVQLQILGQNFTTDTVILIGGIPTASPQFISSTQINCILPPGAGRNNAVTAVNGTTVGLLPNGVSYFSPACPGDANGDGMVNFQDVTAVIAMFTNACP